MVIDELVVVLGLDPRKFTEGQREALAAFKRTKEGAEQLGKDVEAQGVKLGEMFGIVRKGALGLLGAFVGGEAAAFINHVVGMDAATGRMSRTIGTSVENLSTWQYMIRQVGGEATSATATLSTLQQEIESIRQGGGMFQGGFASLMNQAGVSIRDDADTSLRKIQAFISGQIGAGKMKPEEAATFLRRVPGMNQDMLNLLLGDFKRIEEAARNVGTATKDTSDAAETLQKKFSLVVQAIERFVASLDPLLALLTKPLNQLGMSDINGMFKDDPNAPTLEPGSLLDKLWRWQYKKINGVDPPGPTPAPRAPPSIGGALAPALAPSGSRSYSDEDAVRDGLYDPPGSAAAESLKVETDRLRGRGPSDVGARGAAKGRSINNRSSTSNSAVNIGKIEVNAPNATDADGVASEIGSAMKRQSMIAPANYGLA